jgi:protein-disulfide isomerase
MASLPLRILGGAALLALSSSCGGPDYRADATTPARAGVSFSLPSDTGQLVPVPKPSSRVTVIDAFGPTCAPCREKVPALLARKAEMEKNGAKLVLVAVLGDGETTEQAAAALKAWGAESPFLVDRGGVLLRELGLRGLPGAFVLGRSGDVLWEAPPNATADQIASVALDAPYNATGTNQTAR